MGHKILVFLQKFHPVCELYLGQGSWSTLRKKCPYLELQSTLDKWNLHGTEKNSSTYRMFH